ncbi:MAG: glycosyltransferase [bacterium]|nr:MAG: glycosyltransferase [bacterium]
MEQVLLLWSALVFILWLGVLFQWAVGSGRIEDLRELAVPDAEGLPSLSVIIPARNESTAIADSLTSVLRGLPRNGEIILVDDRSLDGTGEIARTVGSGDDRLRVIRIEDLPEGWLGKNHALNIGAASSAGEWLLFTDADVHYHKDCMARALKFALDRGFDHLVVAPEMRTVGFWERTFEPVFLILLLTRLRAWRVNDPGSGSFLGIGAFNLMRRETYDRAGGMEALRDEVVDDLILGRNLRRTGARQGVVAGRDHLWVRWNVGLSGLIQGVEKNAYAAFGYRPTRAAAGCLALAAVTVVPVLSPLALSGWGALPGIGTWFVFALLYRMVGGFTDAPWTYFITFPLGSLLIVYSILRSALLYHLRGGIVWRDTIYRDHGKGL